MNDMNRVDRYSDACYRSFILLGRLFTFLKLFNRRLRKINGRRLSLSKWSHMALSTLYTIYVFA